MSDKAWTTSELIETHKETIIKLKCEGFGRLRAAQRIIELTGRPCSDKVMRTVYERLGSAISKKRTPPIDIRDQSDVIEEQPIESLIASRVKSSERKKAKAGIHRRTLELPDTKPVGILVFGDPHVDNNGCDWAKLYEHVQLANNTDGVLAACVGDLQDNWIGRLARLYANSDVTASDGWRLSEWLLTEMQWIAIVGGNHDAWATGPGVDPLAWLSKKCGVMCYAPDEIRITLQWRGEPELEPIVWVIRHDFSGRSWYHPTHGPHKEAMLDGRVHLLTAGHIHQWGQLTTEQRHGRVTHAVRVRGYIRNDDFARAKGFFEQTYGEAVLIVVDPQMEGPGRIQMFWDVAQGCRYLTQLRNRAASIGNDEF